MIHHIIALQLVFTPISAHWADRTILSPVPPSIIIPDEPVIDRHRILLWKEVRDTASWTVNSQSVDGDEGCFNFSGQIATIRDVEIMSRCLKQDGTLLFQITCDPPNAGMIIRNTVVIPKHGPICKKNDE